MEYLSDMKFKGKTQFSWDVFVISQGSEIETTFAVRPSISDKAGSRLPKLQKDLHIIAEGLWNGVRTRARNYLNGLEAGTLGT
jgi:hypothetical protein